MRRISKDNRDIYYRMAKVQGWRARSAFKLLQINDAFKILKNVDCVVDLCAAPGSWSQVLTKELGAAKNREKIIIAVDVQEIAPLPGVITIQADITKESIVGKITEHLQGKQADLVVCDGSPDLTGLHDLDEYQQSQFVTAALNITTFFLKVNGTFVTKILRGHMFQDFLISKLEMFFKSVEVIKPSSSREKSSESFAVCQEYSPPDGYEPMMWKPKRPGEYNFKGNRTNASIIPYLVCGDLRKYDADTSKPIDEESNNANKISSVQKPNTPPNEQPFQGSQTMDVGSEAVNNCLEAVEAGSGSGGTEMVCNDLGASSETVGSEMVCNGLEAVAAGSETVDVGLEAVEVGSEAMNISESSDASEDSEEL